MRIITFLSDFGDDDWFVAAVKGEIHKRAGDIQIIDIAHNVPRFDIRSAAFLLSAVYRNFPEGTVHLAVVDPGVGGDRKPIIIDAQTYFFVGPDNGIFSYIDRTGAKVYEIDVKGGVSHTFHARDIFGPTAACLASGEKPDRLGKKCKDFIRFEKRKPRKNAGYMQGEIAYIDHFGNCITNIANDFSIAVVKVAGSVIDVGESYSDAGPDGLVCVKGSIGFYEIASNQGSACDLLHAHTGMTISAQLCQHSKNS